MGWAFFWWCVGAVSGPVLGLVAVVLWGQIAPWLLWLDRRSYPRMEPPKPAEEPPHPNSTR